MKPNILFIVIDGLRNDKCHGENKTSFTPILDSLIYNGAYFNNTISSSDDQDEYDEQIKKELKKMGYV